MHSGGFGGAEGKGEATLNLPVLAAFLPLPQAPFPGSSQPLSEPSRRDALPPAGIGIGVGTAGIAADVTRALAAGLAGYLPPRGEGMTLSLCLSLCLAARHPGGGTSSAPALPGVSFPVAGSGAACPELLGSRAWGGFAFRCPGCARCRWLRRV